MKPQFDTIATREIDVVDDAGRFIGQAVVHIGRPRQEPTGEWSLPYRIVGIGEGKTYRVLGIDAIQTLQVVHVVIGSVLVSSDEGKQGRLRWTGDSGLGYLGFPLPPEPVADQ